MQANRTESKRKIDMLDLEQIRDRRMLKANPSPTTNSFFVRERQKGNLTVSLIDRCAKACLKTIDYSEKLNIYVYCE